ncbi:unnamed protein product [Lactuca virosa]|uniref:Translation initiation factor 5A C-terminal domain-containing protein n=1 Tax=Lactuca virosa TaxID=75947 RepID=A0AAU9NL38_9ASTR|nr:unnamed protein product [Lactuca virosa]
MMKLGSTALVVQRLASTDKPNVILLPLISSMERSLKISFPLPTIVPHVNRADYQLIDIYEDGFVSLLTENGGTKDDLKLPTDDSLLIQIKDGFVEGKDLVVTVISLSYAILVNAYII